MNTHQEFDQYTYKQLVQARLETDPETQIERATLLDSLIYKHLDNPLNQAPPAESSSARQVSVRFHGNAKEFFSIWIVNVLLTTLTLGIYSAWATVRTNRYFYSNTEIDGHRFAFLAQPLQILKGRVIAFCLFALYLVLGALSPQLSIAFALILFLLTPVLVCLSLRFKLRMTAFRNVSFDFKGRYLRAVLIFLVLPILSIFTLYLLMPWVLKKVDEFIYENATYGDRKVMPSLATGEYYLASFGAAILGAILMVIVGGLLATVFGVSFATMGEATHTPAFAMIYVSFISVYVLVLLICSSLYHAMIRNHVYNNTQIEDVCTFDSNLSVLTLAWVRLTNFAAIIFSLGFAIPWAKIRVAKMYAEATKVNIMANADTVISTATQSSALADEAADFFDVNIGIG